MKLKAYKVVKTESKTDMERIINDMLDRDFIPLGGICACFCEDNQEIEFYQAMGNEVRSA